MKTVLGVVGVAGLGAAFGPLGWLAWYAYDAQLTATLTYKLTIAILASLLLGTAALLLRGLVGKRDATAGSEAIREPR
jgi:hypothetical protein